MKVSKDNKQIVLNVIGAFIVKGGSLVLSVVMLPLYLRYFKSQEMLGMRSGIMTLFFTVAFMYCVQNDSKKV